MSSAWAEMHLKLVGASNAWLAIVAGLADGCIVVI